MHSFASGPSTLPNSTKRASVGCEHSSFELVNVASLAHRWTSSRESADQRLRRVQKLEVRMRRSSSATRATHGEERTHPYKYGHRSRSTSTEGREQTRCSIVSECPCLFPLDQNRPGSERYPCRTDTSAWSRRSARQQNRIGLPTDAPADR